MFKLLLCLLGPFALAPQLAGASTLERVTTVTSYGATLTVEISVPTSAETGKLPAVVLAPGQKYAMNYPILAGLADKLAAAGVLVFRFDWNYYRKDPDHGAPSTNLVNEVQDLRAVVALAAADPRVDRQRISLGGKSLGSKVAYRVFQSDGSLKSLALLTPTITERWDDAGNELTVPVPKGHAAYPDFERLTRPVMMATSQQDPHCDLNMLADFLRGSNVPVTIVGGDHSWQLSADENDPRTHSNVELGIRFVTDWFLSVL